MRSLLSVVALLLLCGVGLSDPPKVSPQTATVAVNKDIPITVEYDPKAGLVFHPGFDPKECLVFRGWEEPGSGKATFLIRPYVPGKFKVGFLTKGESTFTDFDLTAGGPAPDPGPGPQPQPADPLIRAFATALQADLGTDPGAKTRLPALAAAMYDAEVKAGNAAYVNTAQLLAAVSKKTDELVAGKLPNVRKAIGAHFAQVFGEQVLVLTPDLRTRLAAEYRRTAKSLEVIQ
jgi:hypothetical protein